MYDMSCLQDLHHKSWWTVTGLLPDFSSIFWSITDTSKVSTISTSLIKKRKKSGEENGAAGDADSEPTSAKKPLLEAAAAESTKDSAASKQ